MTVEAGGLLHTRTDSVQRLIGGAALPLDQSTAVQSGQAGQGDTPAELST